MAEPPRVLIAGGSGVFGRLLAREVLDTTDVHVLVTGRDRARAEQANDLEGPQTGRRGQGHECPDLVPGRLAFALFVGAAADRLSGGARGSS